MSQYEIEVFPVGLFQCNCSIIFDFVRKEAMIVDPGDESEKILERLKAHDVSVSALWHTHAHLDHIGATKTIFEACSKINEEKGKPAPQIFLHPEDRWLYDNVKVQSDLLGLPTFEVPKTFEKIKEGQKYENFMGVEALHTPGHTPGSCCLKVQAKTELWIPKTFGVGRDGVLPNVLISGDTLFRRSIGRTDLWGGNSSLILQSIRKKLFSLEPDTVVIPGHGPLTVIEQEIAKNPFLS
jgi:hydroxyacylglutathione hydrolase